jgi:murein DD-endopeptidase MepM/ murein hydrolase activator NlpD
MNSHSPWIVAIVLSLVCMGALARSQGQRPLEVSLAPATIRPGDVVRISIENLGADEHVTAQVLGQKVILEYDAHDRKLMGLLGVDLETAPGSYSISIQHSASASAATRTLHIVPRQFLVRRLKVAPEYVEPPPETLDQIKRDNKALAEAYARISPRLWTGAFGLPVAGKPSSNFGTRSYYNGERRAPHAGVDFASGTGTPVRAANHGTIALAAPLYFTGNTVIVDHGARLFSVFAHLSEFGVKPGDVVEPQTIVGLVGSTGRVTGPHLHWSVRLNGARVDPLSLIAVTSE